MNMMTAPIEGTRVHPQAHVDFADPDLPMMLRIADLPARYRRHFLGA